MAPQLIRLSDRGVGLSSNKWIIQMDQNKFAMPHSPPWHRVSTSHHCALRVLNSKLSTVAQVRRDCRLVVAECCHDGCSSIFVSLKLRIKSNVKTLSLDSVLWQSSINCLRVRINAVLQTGNNLTNSVATMLAQVSLSITTIAETSATNLASLLEHLCSDVKTQGGA